MPTKITAEDPIRVGIIGFGNAGRLIHAPLVSRTEGFRLAAVASKRGDVVRAALPGIAVFHDPEDMLASSEIDLAIVATEPESHASWALAALSAGKHVLVEKPFTVTLAEAARVATAARSADTMLSVFHNRRYDSCFIAVRAAIEAGALGKVNHFESQYNRFTPDVFDAWKHPAAPGSGAWYDLGPHVVDQMIQLFGMPDAISLTQATIRPDCAVDDWFHAVVHYPDMQAVLHSSFMVPGGVPRFTLHGDKASLVKLETDSQGYQLWSGLTPDAPDYGADNDPPMLIGTDGSRRHLPVENGDFRKFYSDLGAAMRGEADNPVPASQAIAVMAVLDAGIRSAREGRTIPVSVPEVA